ncbi:MAG: MFS transporter [Bryobacter sp.]|nr:MFS transporter [Bryobacter sp.]
MLRKVFKAFSYPEFRLMWAGAFTSSVGTWMQSLAQSWVVLQISGSSFLLGLDSFLGQIPIFLFSLFGGVAADRFDRRKVLVVSQLVQLTCAFTLAALFALDLVKVWMILSLSFIVGFVQAFGGPAYAALIPMLVKKEDLPNAIAMNSIQFNLARVIGPMIGGFALAHFGAAWCFSLNGLSYIAVIFSLLTIKIPAVVAKAGESVKSAMKDGIDFIRHQPSMPAIIVLAFLMTFFGLPLVVFLPVIAKEVFKKGPETYTLLLACSGMGSVAGALLVAGLGNIPHKGRWSLLALVLLGIFMFCFALSPFLWLSCVLVFLAGGALIGTFSMITSLVQFLTPDEMRGRVMSVYNVAFRGGMPIGSLVCGELVHLFGAPPVLAVNGVLLVLLACYFLFVQRKLAAV